MVQKKHHRFFPHVFYSVTRVYMREYVCMCARERETVNVYFISYIFFCIYCFSVAPLFAFIYLYYIFFPCISIVLNGVCALYTILCVHINKKKISLHFYLVPVKPGKILICIYTNQSGNAVSLYSNDCALHNVAYHTYIRTQLIRHIFKISRL